ncbi:MAG: hypothetical protein JWR23_3345 [Mucilaginibacter sp.]|nr:hypothetical protein [Mucilaginibacter sp.]
MFKTFVKLLFFVATFVIVLLPVVNLFFGAKSHPIIYHARLSNGEQRHQHYIGHVNHDNSWHFIKTKPLTTPPAPLKIRSTTVINLLILVCFINLAIIIRRNLLVTSIFGTKSLLTTNKTFLTYRMLLI